MPDILQKDEPELRQKATEVSFADISSPKIKKVLKNMIEALESQEDGVAIAAPQIGEPYRIFVVSEKVSSTKKPLIYINPVLVKKSRETAMMEEGCLSVRWLYGKVKRSKKATVKAQNEKGETFTIGASGLLAQVFQHELDHLEGVLFIDKATEIQDIPPEKQKEYAEQK